MHFAPIAPIGSEGLIMSTGYHFCFAEYTASNPDYARFFRNKVEAGETVVMDTMVYEAQIQQRSTYSPQGHEQLFRALQPIMAFAIGAVEPTFFVVPDVIGDPEATMSNFNRFMNDLAPLLGRHSSPMGVPQGHNYQEVADVVHEMGQHTNYFGFSKVHESVTGIDRYTLLLKLLQARSISEVVKIHFLGSDPMFDTAEKAVHDFRTKDMVMGVDCARPVYLGLHNLLMDSPGALTVHRPNDYLNFSPALVGIHKDRIDANIRTVLRWLGN